MISWSMLVRKGVLTGSLCEFMDACVCVFPRVSLNRRRYIRQFCVDDSDGSMRASSGFNAKASELRMSPDSSLFTAADFFFCNYLINLIL